MITPGEYGPSRLFVVIAYDVISDKRRNQIFKTLKNHGRHVQYSVFECELRRQDFAKLKRQLARLIDPREDNIRFYFLDRDAVGKIEQLGVERSISPSPTARFLIL